MLTHNTDLPTSSNPPLSTPEHRRPSRVGARTWITLGLAIAMLAGGVLGSVVTTAVMFPPTASAATLAQTGQSGSIAGAVYRKVGPSIVEILVTGAATRRGVTPSGSGSGIVVDTSGHILTNAHVVDGAGSVQVRFSTGEERTAQVLGADQGNDLAVLKVDLPAGTPAAVLGDSDQVAVGDAAIAIGSPFGLEETVTQGIISAVHRDWQPQGSTLERNLIQTDAPINPGNSGGALLNANGEVIGITAAIESPVRGSVGVGFAVPINTAKQLLPQLESGAQIQPAWLGIRGEELTPALVQAQGLSVQQGVLIDEVVASSPAAQAKLQANDVITAADGAPITTFSQLSTQVANHKPGDTIKLTIARGGQNQQISVTLQARPANP